MPTGAAGMTADASPDGGFNVLSLTNLAMWLDAAKGFSTPTIWKDQSPNHNSVTGSGSDGNNIQLVSVSVNGLPAVGLVGNARLSGGPIAGTFDLGTGDFLVEMVAAWTTMSISAVSLFEISNPPQNAMAFAMLEDATSHGLNAVEAPSLGSTAATVTSTSTNLGDGNFRLLGARRVGASATPTLEVRVNGAAAGSTTSGAGSDLGVTTRTQIGPGSSLKVAEVIVVRGATSADDLARLESYLMTKYALH
jgi:hypothetical protein